jgi:formate-dependent nitrite reductase cytochrome c552 subunit
VTIASLGRFFAFVIFWLSLAAAAWAAEPADKKFMCATCHPKEAQTQPKTPMGIGLQLPAEQTLLKDHPKLTVTWKGYTYSIERKGDLSFYTVSDGINSITLPIRYAFGVHSQTYALEHEGHFYESMVSYYPNVGGLAPTMGDERIQAHSLTEAIGRQTSSEEITNCFGCHSSDSAKDGQLHLESMKPGLDCEHCHKGANAHAEALSHGAPNAIPEKLANKASEDMSNFCGNCHRTWDTVIRMRTWGEMNVRFQPYRLAMSKCFLGNDRRIACTACHNPHSGLVRDDPKSYDAKCLACHPTSAAGDAKGGSGPAGTSSQAATPKFCPVAKEACTSCHMPKVELPGSQALFTDHYIRVVHPGERYPD